MIALIDYGAGNLRSVANALDDLNAKYIITNKIEELNSAEKIIFPGVGEATSAMTKIEEKGIVEAIKSTTKPLLGICLGMQLLATFSEERSTKCLGVVEAVVKQFDSSLVKVPHMGWNKVEFVNQNKLFNDISSGEHFYFANSFYVPITEYTIASTNYGVMTSASINKNNFYGVQFHPEKSGEAGLKNIKEFYKLMLAIPAIDIMDGKIVRLSKGKYESVVTYSKTPLEQAKLYDDLGFDWLHIVDLSGSKDGKINTTKIIEEIKNKTNLKVEFGGGIRSKKDIVELDNLGVDGIIVGSLSVSNKSEFETVFPDINPNKIIIAADVLDYMVRIKGWTENSNIHLFDHIEYCSSLGINNFLCTDIAVDGMLTGPSFDLYNETLQKCSDIELTASGGVSNLDDVIKLKELPIRGVVIGKAIYENKINIKELAKLAL